MGVSVTRTVKYILKGDKGEKGASLRGPQAWSDCATGYSFQAGGQGDTWKDVVIYGDNYYSCVKNHAKTATNYPGSTEDSNNGYWQLGDKIELVATKILLATYALVKNLGVEAIEMKGSNDNVLFEAKDGKVACKTGTFENIVFSGTMQGVSGSFKSLVCVDNDGREVGEITFSPDGRVTFNSCDMQHQGVKNNRSLRFLTSNLWCRGAFGTNVKNYAVISGNVIYYYVNGNNTDYVRAIMSSQPYNGNTYYKIPLYADSIYDGLTYITANGNCKVDDIYGFPVDMIIFNCSGGTWYYNLIGDIGKEVTIINVNDTMNGIRYASCQHVDQQLVGGAVHTLINVPSFIYPSRANGSIDKSGWMLKGIYDNNYN